MSDSLRIAFIIQFYRPNAVSNALDKVLRCSYESLFDTSNCAVNAVCSRDVCCRDTCGCSASLDALPNPLERIIVASMNLGTLEVPMIRNLSLLSTSTRRPWSQRFGLATSAVRTERAALAASQTGLAGVQTSALRKFSALVGHLT